MDSFSNLGSFYKHPQYAFETTEASTFLAGIFNFHLDEIEVYQKEFFIYFEYRNVFSIVIVLFFLLNQIKYKE